jgi:beta-galactosidase GanA
LQISRGGNIIMVQVENEYYTRLFAKEQSYRSMLRILGY